MQDAVASVLNERRGSGPGLSAGVLLSAALHASIFGAFFLKRSTAESVQVSPALTIRLASPSPTAAVSREPAKRPAAALPAAIKTPEAVIAPAPKAVAPEPVKSVPVTEKSLFGKQDKLSAPPEKKAVTPLTRPVPAPLSSLPSAVKTSQPPAVGKPLPALGAAGVASFEGGTVSDFYVQRMLTLIGEHWFRPNSGDLIAQVFFKINRDGNIAEVKIVKSSGNELFDRAALRSIAETSRLPALPPPFNGQYLGVTLTFH